MRTVITLLFLLAAPAWAVDPACEGEPQPPSLNGCDWRLPKGTSDVSFCSPQRDIDGDVLESGQLSTCAISVDGAQASMAVTEPGVVITFSVGGKGGGHQVLAWCSNVSGDGEQWAAPLCFNPGVPQSPSLLLE